MSLFKKDNSVEESQEFAGYSVLPTNVYKAVIKQAYLRLVKGQNGVNVNMNWKLDIEDEGERSFNNIFVAKQIGSDIVYYSEKDGKRTEYPAFGALRRHLDNLLGKSVFDEGVLTQKVLPVYDYNEKKDVPMEVYSIDEVVGLTAAFGIVENHENGYKDPSKLVKNNTIERVWTIHEGQPYTREEIKAGLAEPKHCLSWKSIWEGKVNDRNLDKGKLDASTGSTKTTQALEIG